MAPTTLKTRRLQIGQIATALVQSGRNPATIRALADLADVEAASGNLDPESIRERITRKTKAIVVVHYGGRSCKMDAIRSLTEAFATGKGSLPPEVSEVFERNLSVIDATIQACRRSVLEAPDDLEARNYLMAAYTQKITLLDSALDLQRRDRPAAGTTKTL
jgi:hypothetical protein